MKNNTDSIDRDTDLQNQITVNNTDSIARDEALGQRIDNTDATVAQNNTNSINRDTLLQTNIDTNKATADAQNTTTNERITTETARLDGVNAAQDATIAKGVNVGGTTGSNNYQLGDSINILGDSNVTSTTTAGGVQLALNPNIALDSLTTGNTTVTTAGVAITGGANGTVALTNTGLNNGNNKITNVAAGTAATDAVNVSQLQGVGAEFGQRLNRQNKELSGGIASAVAMGMMPTLSEPGKMITGGTGLYNGEGAVAIGLTGTTQDSKITYKAGATFVTNGDASVGAGFGYRF